MKKRLIGILAAGAVVLPLLATPASAFLVDVTNSPDGFFVGDSFSVDLVFSDLGAGTDPSLASYDINVVFDDLLFSLTSVTFASDLGGVAVTSSYDNSTPYIVELMGDTAPATAADLNTNQADMFTAATLTFTAITPGNGYKPGVSGGTVTLTAVDPITNDDIFVLGKIAIKKKTICKIIGKKGQVPTAPAGTQFPTTDTPCTAVYAVAVPEPATFFLVLTGLAGLTALANSPWARRKRRALLARAIRQ